MKIIIYIFALGSLLTTPLRAQEEGLLDKLDDAAMIADRALLLTDMVETQVNAPDPKKGTFAIYRKMLLVKSAESVLSSAQLDVISALSSHPNPGGKTRLLWNEVALLRSETLMKSAALNKDRQALTELERKPPIPSDKKRIQPLRESIYAQEAALSKELTSLLDKAQLLASEFQSAPDDKSTLALRKLTENCKKIASRLVNLRNLEDQIQTDAVNAYFSPQQSNGTIGSLLQSGRRNGSGSVHTGPGTTDKK